MVLPRHDDVRSGLAGLRHVVLVDLAEGEGDGFSRVRLALATTVTREPRPQ